MSIAVYDTWAAWAGGSCSQNVDLAVALETTQCSESPRLVQKDVYEGGDDIWECAGDLAAHLSTCQHPIQTRPMLKILEIGAGHGIPTLALCQRREEAGFRTRVVLQDLNKESLMNHALPKFRQLNPSLTSVDLVSCSWTSMLEYNIAEADGMRSSRASVGYENSKGSADHKQSPDALYFDLVLSAETLYRKEHFEVLSALLYRVLRVNPNAYILFAQKRFYFGLGGGSMPFQLFLKERPILRTETIRSMNTRKSNIRDILWIMPM